MITKAYAHMERESRAQNAARNDIRLRTIGKSPSHSW